MRLTTKGVNTLLWMGVVAIILVATFSPKESVVTETSSQNMVTTTIARDETNRIGER